MSHSCSPLSVEATPSDWLLRFSSQITPGLILDMACGGGRNIPLLAQSGQPVLAVDRDKVALQRVAALGFSNVQTLAIDLENDDEVDLSNLLLPGRFSTVTIVNYLYRPAFSLLFDSVAPGGLLLVDTFAEGNEQYGRPTNPDFLLRSGELLSLVKDGWQVLAYEEGYFPLPKPSMRQRIAVMRRLPA